MTEKQNWLSRLKNGLQKSADKLTNNIRVIISGRVIDHSTLEDLEEILLSSDIGAAVTGKLIKDLSKQKFNQELSYDEVKEFLADKLYEILQNCEKKLTLTHTPEVFLMCGVNGNGKTTTSGKLAAKFVAEGKKVVIAACDTFRAAAVEQLEIWSKRANCEFIRGAENQDPASVAYNALVHARNINADILIIDTAGRLQNKVGLMDELKKIVTTLGKIDNSAPHHKIMVLDATTGQNAHSQTEIFNEYIKLTGLVITKLDGSAKAGVAISLADKFKLPIYAIGVGEQVDDLQEFNAKEFIRNLLGKDE